MGKTIVFNGFTKEPPFSGYDYASPVVIVDTTTGAQQKITDNLPLAEPTWLPDGRGFLALLDPPRKLLNLQVVFLSHNDGIVHQITHDTSAYSGISLASDQKILATVVVDRRGVLEVSSSVRADVPEFQLTSPVNEPWYGFSWTRDGALTSSAISQNADLAPQRFEANGVELARRRHAECMRKRTVRVLA